MALYGIVRTGQPHIMVYEYPTAPQSSDPEWSSTELLPDCPETRWNRDTAKRFITASCSGNYGLGNKMFQIASLYGIGRTLGRAPFFDKASRSQQGNLVELAETFPNLRCNLRILLPKDTKQVQLGKDCCTYQHPFSLRNVTDTYVRLSTEYLHSYKFFDAYRKGIMDLFDFGDTIKREVASFVAHGLPNFESRHKMCVHVRRGDFVRHRFLESTKENVEAIVEYALKHVKEKNQTDVVAILLGEEEAFFNTLNLTGLHKYEGATRD
ncbi:Protein Y5H2B.1 [Aphelenchoides avenae]|nr:Protein Y5H2B.1 [Aphelenchus avenae]